MKKRRHPPSEKHIEIANRVLAEMIIRRPEPQQRPPPPRSTTTGHSPIKVKQEPGEEKVVRKDDPPLAKPVAMSLVDFSFVLSLVFGGCCTNVWTYEYLLKMDSRMGTALTFSQMAFVTLHSLPSFLILHKTPRMTIPHLKPRQVPLSQWALQVLVLTTGSLLNNWAFAYQVPLTVQIVFRSAGLAVSLLFGRLFLNKRYSSPQILSVLFVTLGVIFATTSRPIASVQDTAHVTPIDIAQYTTGIVMLTASLLLTGVLGLLQERTYTKYGPCWREGLFYTHALSLPIFLLFIPNILHGLHSLKATSIQATPHFPDDDTRGYLTLLGTYLATTYKPYLILTGNLITQLVCVSGVNQLTSRVSSVSTNLVLTTRKAMSLCFSVWWFGNGWNTQLGAGAGMVFAGSVMYTLVTTKTPPPSKAPPKFTSKGLSNGFPKKPEETSSRKLSRTSAILVEPRIKEE